jgi:CRP/FNR family transcriptional regulator
MNNLIKNHYNTIKNLTIFANLNERELEIILQNCHIQDYREGEIIFSDNQEITNFYIVLEGLVKLSKINENGEELTINIINSGGYLTDISGKTFLATSKTLSETIVLIIGLNNFKKQLRENHSLAINMLFDLSSQNRALDNHISTLKLNDSKHKVGQFLLKNAFIKGKKYKNTNLTIKKSDIASYLGIKPETLSRNLEKLKNDGEIMVEKNRIILTKGNALCQYCDSEISSICSHKSSSC